MHVQVNAVVADRYRIEARLGDGGMSSVYRAFDTVLERIVALKVIDERLARDARAFERVRREAATIAAVRSPHVVQVFDLTMHGPTPVVVMELVDGEDLDSILAEHTQHRTRIDTRRVVSIVRQTAEGLAALHAAGIVHRDVKPANILIERDTGRTVLVDLGIARRDGRGPTGEVVYGTPAYLAPEQATNGIVSPRSDVYALACTAFDLLTGQPPFSSQDALVLLHHHANVHPPALSEFRLELESFDAIFDRALSKSPDDRYQGVIAFAQALEEVLPPLSSIPAPPTSSISHPIFPLDRPRTNPTLRGSKDPIRILVVDGEAEHRELARSAAQLAMHGSAIRMKLAEDGQTALAEAAQKPFDLVLLDLDMPGLDGIDLLGRMRDLPGAERMRVVVFSDRIGDHERWQFASLGVGDFVEKSTPLRDMVKTVRELAKRSGWIR